MKKIDYLNLMETRHLKTIKNNFIVEKAHELFDDIIISYNLERNEINLFSDKSTDHYNKFKIIKNRASLKIRCCYDMKYTFNNKDENFEINVRTYIICRDLSNYNGKVKRRLKFNLPPYNLPEKYLKDLEKRCLDIIQGYPDYTIDGNVTPRVKKMLGFV